MNFAREFLEALRHVAESPYALVAYAIAVPFLLIAFVKLARIRTIAKLPPADRAAALQFQNDSAPLRQALPPTQWMRHQVLLSVFYFGLAIVVAATILTAIVLIQRSTDPSSNRDGYHSSVTDTQRQTHALTLYTSPDRADVEIDGRWRGLTPRTVLLAPGTHSIRISKSGYRTITDVVEVPRQTVVSHAMEAR